MKYRILFMFCACILNSCSYKDAYNYSIDIIQITNEVHSGFSKLDSRVENVAGLLKDGPTINSLLLKSLYEVNEFDRILYETEMKIKEFPDFNNDNHLKFESVKFISFKRQEILPVYKRYFEIILTESVELPTSENDGQQIIESNDRIIKSIEDMILVIGKNYRSNTAYTEMHSKWKDEYKY